MKRKLLWIGDAVAQTGFARITHEVLKAFSEWEVFVLGLNYLGDPHEYPYKIYPCYPGGDFFGFGRVQDLVTSIKPDVILIENDPWNFSGYLRKLHELPVNIPVVGMVAVDSLNVDGRALNECDHIICWTEFAKQELIKGGCDRDITVIPLGVDRTKYFPIEQRKARKHLFEGNEEHEKLVDSAFIVGSASRNSPRKRLDLACIAFSQWVKKTKNQNAFLWLHVPPTKSDGLDLRQLMKYLGVSGRLILTDPDGTLGAPESELNYVYNCWDVGLYPAAGEGWGLPAFEGMTCGIPHLLSENSAYEEWAKDSAKLMRCDHWQVSEHINTIGCTPGVGLVVSDLQDVYTNSGMRDRMREASLKLTSEPRFSWSVIGAQYEEICAQVVAQYKEDLVLA